MRTISEEEVKNVSGGEMSTKTWIVMGVALLCPPLEAAIQVGYDINSKSC